MVGDEQAERRDMLEPISTAFENLALGLPQGRGKQRYRANELVRSLEELLASEDLSGTLDQSVRELINEMRSTRIRPDLIGDRLRLLALDTRALES